MKQYETTNRDGMDMALCIFDRKEKILEYAGAKSPLYYIQNGQLHEIKGDKMPIGGLGQEKNEVNPEDRTFTKHLIKIDSPTKVYILSDGYQDQFGEINRKKFSRSRLRDLLLEIHQKPMEEQKEILIKTIVQWQGHELRIDDILVFGFQVG